MTGKELTMVDINQAIAEVLMLSNGASVVQPEHNLFDEYGMDSLDHVEIVMALEELAERDITDEQCADWTTVSDIYKTMGIQYKD